VKWIFGFQGDSNEVASTHDRVAVKRIEAEAEAAAGSPQSLPVESILIGIEGSAPSADCLFARWPQAAE
jgi:hypothetical protein